MSSPNPSRLTSTATPFVEQCGVLDDYGNKCSERGTRMIVTGQVEHRFLGFKTRPDTYELAFFCERHDRERLC
jgi:hypothetical protein